MWWLLVLALFLPLRSWAAAPVASATSPAATCSAPCVVFFDGTGTTDADLTEPLLDLDMHWDFGDPGSGTWDYGAQATATVKHSRNEDKGMVAGHLYETAGSYTTTLTACDGTSCDTATVAVTITNPDDDWPTTSTICVANGTTPVAGSGGCPTGAAVADNGDFDDAILNTCNVDGAANRCLFKRSDTFTAASANLALFDGSRVGAYGPGGRAANPQVNLTVAGDLFNCETCDDVQVMDLKVDGTDVSASKAVWGGNGTNVSTLVTVLRLDVTDMAYIFNGACGACIPDQSTTDPATMHTDHYILDNTGDSMAPGSGNGYGVYIETDRWLVMGNSIKDTHFHHVRSPYFDGAVLSHNTTDHQIATAGNLNFKLHGGHADDPGTPDSRYIVVRDNYTHPSQDTSIDIGQNSTQNFEEVRRWIIEGNLIECRLDDTTNCIGIRATCGPGVIRNNIVDLRHTVGSPDSGYNLWGIRLQTQGTPTGCVGPDDVRIYHNTVYSDEPDTTGTNVFGIDVDTSNADNTIVKNNLCYFRGAETAVDCIDDQGTGTTFCSTGVGDGDCNITVLSGGTNPFGVIPAGPPALWDNFDLASGANTAVDVGDSLASEVLYGANLECRYSTSGAPIHGAKVDAGAWERDASVEVCPRPTANLRGIQLQGIQISEAPP